MFSCRVDALTILRNALLHVKYMRQTNPSFDLSGFLTGYHTVPREWSYSSQIFNESEADQQLMHFRSCFSKQAGKPVSMVSDHIRKHTIHINIETEYSRCVGSNPFRLREQEKISGRNAYLLHKGFNLTKDISS